MTDLRENAAYKQSLAAMTSLLKELSKLAPHPDKPDDKGPVSIKLDKSIVASATASDDSGLGSFMMESLVDTAFGGMLPSAVQDINFSTLLNTYEIYRHDKDSSDMAMATREYVSNIQEETPSESFRKSRDRMIKDYLIDQPRRIILERRIGILAKKMGSDEVIDENPLYNFAPSPKYDYASVV